MTTAMENNYGKETNMIRLSTSSALAVLLITVCTATSVFGQGDYWGRSTRHWNGYGRFSFDRRGKSLQEEKIRIFPSWAMPESSTQRTMAPPGQRFHPRFMRSRSRPITPAISMPAHLKDSTGHPTTDRTGIKLARSLAV